MLGNDFNNITAKMGSLEAWKLGSLATTKANIKRQKLRSLAAKKLRSWVKTKTNG